jgi:hypothetical protein
MDTREQEYQIVRELFNKNFLTLLALPELEGFLIEEWNNDIIDRMDEEGISFEDAFREIYKETSGEVILSYGEAYLIIYEHFANQVYDRMHPEEG